MTMASCGTVTAQTIGLPSACAVRAEKGSLPKGLFAAKVPLSAKTKQHLIHNIESITMLGIMRPENTGVTTDPRVPEVLVLGLQLASDVHTLPTDIIELIGMQRKSGIVFAVLRTVEEDGALREECAFAVRRALVSRAGHMPTFHVFHSSWEPVEQAHLELKGSTTRELWDSLNSQIILGTPEYENLDARIAREQRITQLESTIAKLTADHQRTKNTEKRNEIYAKLHKAKLELEQLR